jgi:hypothetical protein
MRFVPSSGFAVFSFEVSFRVVYRRRGDALRIEAVAQRIVGRAIGDIESSDELQQSATCDLWQAATATISLART